MADLVKIAFERKVIMQPIADLLPTKALPAGVRETVKYRRIAASVAEVGLIEPLSIARQKGGGYLLLDGHMRLESRIEPNPSSSRVSRSWNSSMIR